MARGVERRLLLVDRGVGGLDGGVGVGLARALRVGRGVARGFQVVADLRRDVERDRLVALQRGVEGPDGVAIGKIGPGALERVAQLADGRERVPLLRLLLSYRHIQLRRVVAQGRRRGLAGLERLLQRVQRRVGALLLGRVLPLRRGQLVVGLVHLAHGA